jgi:hypothetical protein
VIARVAVLALLLGLTAGCGGDDGQHYCAMVEKEAPGLTRMVDEAGQAGLLEVLPTLEELARSAPEDVEDDWHVFLSAIRDLRDTLEETGVDPRKVGKLPEDLPADDRKAITAAASRLLTSEVTAAAETIDQQALDVCHTPLL